MSLAWHAAVASVAAFVIAFVASMPLAGPISVIVVSRAARNENRVAMAMATGAAIAEGGYAGLALWGFATFLARHPLATPISHAVSALVLLAMGVHFMTWELRSSKAGGGKAGLLVGFAVAALNPTLLVTWSVVVAALDARGVVLTPILALPFGVSAAAGIVAWNATLLAVLHRFAGHVPKATVTRLVRGMGVLLVAVGGWTAVSVVRVAVHYFSRA